MEIYAIFRRDKIQSKSLKGIFFNQDVVTNSIELILNRIFLLDTFSQE